MKIKVQKILDSMRIYIPHTSLNTITVSVFVLLLMSSCGDKSKKEDNQEGVKTAINVKVEKVESSDINFNNEYTAMVKSKELSKIMPAMPGRIRKIAVGVGDNVRKGQVLAIMDDASLTQQKSLLDNLEKDFSRFQELFNVGGISKQQLDQLDAQLSVARSTYENLRENTSLISPINGVVTISNFEQGDMVSQMPILVVENYNPVKLVINVEEHLFTQIKKGKEVSVNLDVYPDREFLGKVSLIHPTISQGSHTFSIEIEIANNEMLIRPGMFARVKLSLGTKNSMLISDVAVMKKTGSNSRFVYVVENGKAVSKDITVGQHINDKYEITSGLSDGDMVITMGASRLTPKDNINIVD